MATRAFLRCSGVCRYGFTHFGLSTNLVEPPRSENPLCGCGATNRAGLGAELVWGADAAPKTGLTGPLVMEGGGGYSLPLAPLSLFVGIRAEAGDRGSDLTARSFRQITPGFSLRLVLQVHLCRAWHDLCARYPVLFGPHASFIR